MKKLLVVFAFAAVSAFAEGEIEYVTLQQDSTNAYDSKELKGKNNWSDGEAPHSGADYLVPAGLKLELDNASFGTFGGDSLTCAGNMVWNGGWGKTFTPAKPLTMRSGNLWQFSSYHFTFTADPLIVEATAASPATFRFNNRGSGDNVDHYYPSTFQSAEDGYLIFETTGATFVNATKLHLESANLSAYNGTLVCRRGVDLMANSLTMPGTLEVGTNIVFSLAKSDGESSFGGLRLRTGSTLKQYSYNTHLIKIAKKLEIEPGAVILPYKFKTWSTQTAEKPDAPNYPVFELTAEAVAASGDLEAMMAGVEVPTAGVNIKYGLPHLCWRIVDVENGGKQICLSYRPIIAQTQNLGWGNYAFSLKQGAGATTDFWSDTRYPHDGVDYFNTSGGNTIASEGGSVPYVFPGETLVVPTPFGLYNGYRDFTANLTFAYGQQFRAMAPGFEYHLRGKITIANEKCYSDGTREDLGETTAAYNFNSGEHSTLVLDAPISGHGLIGFGMNYEGNTKAVNQTVGFAELAGDNTGFDGKVSVSCWQAAGQTPKIPDSYAAIFPADAPYAAGPNSNITLSVSAPENLGGPRAEFAFDALKVNNECRLRIKETATFADATRGWYFPANAYLKVDADKTATVKQTVTFGDGAHVVKEGAGTLILGAAVAEDGAAVTPVLEVAAGALGFAASDALSGVRVTLAADVPFVVDATTEDADLKAKGLVVIGTPFGASGAIPVAFNVGELGADDSLSVGVMTLADDAAADAMLARLKFKHVSRHRVTVTKVANGDGTVTLKADIEPTGFAILVR